MSSSLSDSGSQDYNDDYRGLILESDKGNFYAVLKKLGSGVFSSVWLGCLLQTNEFFALKILNIGEDKSARREIDFYNILKKETLQLCNIKEHFTAEIDDDTEQTIIVFELMGCTLEDLLKTDKYSDGLPYNIAINITKQILSTINVFNKHGMIHTDLKPENILVRGENKSHKEFIKKFKDYNVKRKYDSKVNKNKHKWANLDITKMEEIVKAALDIIHPIKDDTYCSSGNSDSDDSLVWSSESSQVSEISEISKVSETNESDNNTNNDSYDNVIDLPINLENITNIKIVVGDLGTVLKDNHNFSIQTRYYRAPEIILQTSCTNKLDVWSIGCMLYELLTGTLLFSPEKTIKDNRDRGHLFEFVSVLGPLPDNQIEMSPRKTMFFTNNNLLKGHNDINYEPLSIRINKLDSLSNEEKIMTTHLLYQMLEYDPIKRSDITTLLNHPAFQM